MKRLIVLLVSAAFIAACGGSTAGAAAQQSAPPGPVTKYKNTLPGQTAAAPIDLIQTVIDFQPGAASVVHTHLTPNLATVLLGQITVKTPSGDKKASAGDALIEPVGQPVQAINMGSGEATVLAAFPVRRGTKPTTPVAGQLAPATPNKTLSSFTLDSPSISGGYSIVQQILVFAPGAQTQKHRHGGPGVITVIQGQVTLSRDGVEKTYNVGDSFTETPGQALQAFNRGSTELIVAATFLLPDGTQLTTNI
jgi:quercetin dioxygenase-like cupin family protein